MSAPTRLVRDDSNWQLWPQRSSMPPRASSTSGTADRPGVIHRLLQFVGVRVDDALVRWATDRGLSGVGPTGALTLQGLDADPAWLEDRLHPMRSAGVDHRLRGGIALAGPLWAAAPDATLAQARLVEGDDPLDLTFVSVPLAPEVGARYAGLVVELGGRARRMVSVTGGVVRLGWTRTDFEQHADRLGFEVHVAPTQDPIAVHELVDPTFLEQLAARADMVRDTRCGIVVADGHLVVWSGYGLLHGLAVRAPDDRVEHLVELARDMHRRLVTTWD